jgi:hypothetical protein
MNDGWGVAPRPQLRAAARLLQPPTAPSAALAPHGASHDDQHQAVTQDLSVADSGWSWRMVDGFCTIALNGNH